MLYSVLFVYFLNDLSLQIDVSMRREGHATFFGSATRYAASAKQSCSFLAPYIYYGTHACMPHRNTSENYFLRKKYFFLTARRYCALEGSCGTSFDSKSTQTCINFDDMCRTRVLNYVTRHFRTAGKEKLFIMSRCTLDSKFCWMANLKIPIPGKADLYATGFAETEKDAELACTAHAEAMLDALNIPIFSLASGQRKYAEQKRREGKNAPIHGEMVRQISDVNLPLPHHYIGLDAGSRNKLLNTKIRYIRSSKDDEAELEESENGKYTVVSLPLQSYASASNFIVNPGVYDSNAVNRMHRLYHTLFGVALESAVRVNEVTISKETSGGVSTYIDYHASVKLPLDEKIFGDRVAYGVGRTSRFAISLCAMHMELIFDAVGVPIFKREDSQRTHAEGVRKTGRWAPLPGDSIRAQAATPLPLKRGSAISVADSSVSHVESALRGAVLKEVDVIDSSAVILLKKLHCQFRWPLFSEKNSIFKIVNRGMLSSHRRVTATYRLPVDESVCGERNAIGISKNIQSAEILCCMHALMLIEQLNVRKGYEGVSKSTPNPPVPCLLNTNIGPQDIVRASGPPASEGKRSAVAALSGIKKHELISPETQRQMFQRIDWHIESADKYSLVRYPTKISSEYALIRAHEVDYLSRARISKYLSTRSPPENVRNMFQQSKILMVNPNDSNDYQIYYRSRARLHITGIGFFVATGESFAADDAESLACMHAELLIDHLGGQFFQHADAQTKRRSLTIKAGRWAPGPHDGVRPEAKGNLPPPLRRHPDARYSGDFKTLVAEEMLDDGNNKYDTAEVQDYHENQLQTVNAVLQQHNIAQKNIIAQMQYSRLRISEGSPIYQASVKLDIDIKYGDRRAIGLAKSKANAEKMCVLHALRIFQALGITCNTTGKDRALVQSVKIRGNHAETSRDSDSIPSPLPVRELGCCTKSMPIFPAFLPHIHIKEQVSAWETYGKEVIIYLQTIQQEKDHEFLSQGRVPRTGEPFVDEALDAVETSKASLTGCQQALRAWCDSNGLEYPQAISFRALKSHGLVHSYFHVPGYPLYVAHGVHNNKVMSIKRAMAHCVYMLMHLDDEFRDNFQTKRDRLKNNWDFESHCPSHLGEAALFSIYEKATGAEPYETSIRFDKESSTYEAKITFNDAKCGPIFAHSKLGTKNGALQSARSHLISKLVLNRAQTEYDITSFLKLLQRFPIFDPRSLTILTLPTHRVNFFSALMQDINTSRLKFSLSDKGTSSYGKLTITNTALPYASATNGSLHASIQNQLCNRISDVAYRDIYTEQRKALPINQMKRAILECMEQEPILIVCSAAGSGKTTQIPQFILDNEQSKGRVCSIAITQPRRISAVSVALRVAQERKEQVGDSVGYMVRLDAKQGTSINFVTGGILFKMLKRDPSLSKFTHIILDEVHERDIYTDLLAALLRELVKRRPGLKIIVMSATMHASSFSQYFSNAPVLRCDHGMYEVEIKYLEDIAALAATKKVSTPSLVNLNLPAELCSAHKVPVKAKSAIDYRLLSFLIDHCISAHNLESSCILVFLPGWQEIMSAREALTSIENKVRIVVMHSSMNPKAHSMALETSETECLKVVLSTNICESAITIRNVRIVIDCGRMKQKIMHYNESSRSHESVLLHVHASQANCIQRSGRAGRTQSGVCYRMFTREHFDALPPYQAPEITRSNLDDICLSILSLGIKNPKDFLQHEMLESPCMRVVENAMLKLKDTGAVDSALALTNLGKCIDLLPVKPNVGKMILYGVALSCLDFALTLAATLDVNPLVLSYDLNEDNFVFKDALEGACDSDHMASVSAYNEWAKLYEESQMKATDFIHDNNLSEKRLEEISLIKHQIHSILCAENYIAEKNSCSDKRFFIDKSTHSDLAHDETLKRALIACALYPNIAIREAQLCRTKVGSACIDQASILSSQRNRTQTESFSQLCVFSTASRQQNRVSDSIEFRLKEITSVPLWSLLLCAVPSDSLEFLKGANILIIDGWVLAAIDKKTLQIVDFIKQSLLKVLESSFPIPSDATLIRQIRSFLVQILKDGELNELNCSSSHK